MIKEAVHHSKFGSVWNMDAIEFLGAQSIPVPLQIHDIPYGVSASAKKKSIKRWDSKGGRHDLQRRFGEWDDSPPDLSKLAEGCDRAAARDANVCIFFNNWEHSSELVRNLNRWFDQVHQLAWIKGNPPPQIRKRHFLAGHETILWASRGDYPLNFISQAEMRSWFKSGICQGHDRIKGPDGKSLHGAQKPRAVINWLIERLSFPGDTVLDAYAGVLSTAHSAVQLNRRYAVSDLDKVYLDAGIARLKEMENE